MSEINKTYEAQIDPLELVALRGLDSQQCLLQIEIEDAARKIDESRALVYAAIETRLKLTAGSILNGTAKINGETIVWEDREETVE